MVAKIADLGMARLVFDGTKNLTKRPGNIYYMPPEAEGCDYNESLDVFSFGVLTLFTLIQSDPVPKLVKDIEKGKSICRTEVQRRSTYLEQLRDHLKGQEGLVEVVEQCLHDDPAERPNIQDGILPPIKAAKLETSTKYLGMSKLDLLQTVERERKERKEEQEEHKREQQEEMDRHRKEQEKLQEEHNKEQSKHKKELIQLQRELNDYTVQMKQKEKVIQEKQQELLEREANYKLAMKAKDEELEEMIRQTKQEKSAAVQQKENEIVAELREILWAPAGRGRELGRVGGDAVGRGGPAVTKKGWKSFILLSVGLLLLLFFVVQIQLKSTGEGELFCHGKLQYPATLSGQTQATESLMSKPEDREQGERKLQCKKNETETTQETCKKERKLLSMEQERCKKEKEQLMQEQKTCKKERELVKGEQETCKKEKEQEQETCKKEREQLTVEQEICKKEKEQLKREQETCKKEKEQLTVEQETFKKEKEQLKREQETCNNEQENQKGEQETCEKKRSAAVMIIGSVTPPPTGWVQWVFQSPSPDVVPQIPSTGNKRSNLDTLLALYNKTKNYDVFSVQVSRPGKELSRSYILEQIEILLRNTKQTVILHYYGNSQKNTGDWSFGKEFITFRDIADLYMKHSHGRVLTIVSDCHSSGRWVSECAKFLDEQEVKPCGHSAREKAILLKIFASCQTGQDSAELAYTTQGLRLGEDGFVYRPTNKYLSAKQKAFGVDFTKLRCGKGKEENCDITLDATWSTAGEVVDYPNFIGPEQQQQAVTQELEEKIKILNQTQFLALVIIGSITPPPSTGTGKIPSSVIPQTTADLSEDDGQLLTDLGIPPDKWNNLNALRALYGKSKNGVLSVQVSRPGMELSRSYILEQIEFIFRNTKNTVVLHYYGNGRRNTGDWCFRDGFITFRDIADLYMKHSRGRFLTIVSDCHSSGRWVSECAKFLDEKGVKPCGHSAREKGILLKVYTSCRTGQDSAELAYTTQAMELRKDGIMWYWFHKTLSTQQKTFGADFAFASYGKGEKKECNIPSDATWEKSIQ